MATTSVGIPPAVQAPGGRAGRIPELDGIRGIAILLVLVWHYYVGQLMVEPGTAFSYVARVLILAWSGVDLFFVLSGFLIAGILLDHRADPAYFKVFYARRICRIFPLYYLVFSCYLVAAATPLASLSSFQWLFQEPMPLWSYASFTQNVFMAQSIFGANWLAMTWSLAVEEQFYLLVPLLVYFLPRKLLVWVLLTAIFTAPVLRYFWPGMIAYVGTPWRSDSLFSGALLAVCVRSEVFVLAARQHRALLISLLGTLVLCTANLAWRAARPDGVLVHFVLALLFSIFLLVVVLEDYRPLNSILRGRLLIWFGRLSFGIYMFHQPVSGLMHGFLRRAPPEIHTASDALVTLVSIAATLALAALSFRFFELPFLRIGEKFRYAPAERTGVARLHVQPLVATVSFQKRP